MDQTVVSKEDSEIYDKFVKTIQTFHTEMFKDAGIDQRIMSLYVGAVNMIGNIYQHSSAKDKRIMLRGFISDVRNNFRKKKVLE
jgi:hypothetical protein